MGVLTIELTQVSSGKDKRGSGQAKFFFDREVTEFAIAPLWQHSLPPIYALEQQHLEIGPDCKYPLSIPVERSESAFEERGGNRLNELLDIAHPSVVALLADVVEPA